MRHRYLFGVLAAALIVGCQPVPLPPTPPAPPDASEAGPPPLPPPTPAPDAGDAPDGNVGPPATAACSLACAALQAAGCPLGAHPDCGSFLDRDLAPGKVANAATGKALTCAAIQAVHTRADVLKLGLVCQ